MFYPVKVYNKLMQLVRTIKSKEISDKYWDKHTENTKALRTKKKKKRVYIIKCVVCSKKVEKKRVIAKYCSSRCRNKMTQQKQRRKKNAGTTKGNSTKE